MQNSFNLGLLHGALYGITPIAPLFIGLKRYVFEGQAKGLLTFAGIFTGQIFLLLLAFFGGTELLWLWYYLEPALMVIGLLSMLYAIRLCWIPSEVAKPLINRKEGLIYLGTGVLYAFCNPCGIGFGDLLFNALPPNPLIYLVGFIGMYATCAATLIYVICLSPLGQKFFGVWSIARMRNGQEPSLTSYKVRARSVQVVACAALVAMMISWYNSFVGAFGTFYVDLALGGTPAQAILPMRDFYWVESNQMTPVEEGEEEMEPTKVWKLQSNTMMNWDLDEDAEYTIEEASPWHTVYMYNELNEKLEREGISNALKAREVKYYEEKGPNTKLLTRLVNWYERSPLRFRYKPAMEWEEKNEQNPEWLNELTKVREEMDEILLAQSKARFNLPRAHVPFNYDYDKDYQSNPEIAAKYGDVTEDDAVDLEALKNDPEVRQTDFFTMNYDMMHRGYDQVDFGGVKLQDLPKEVHFPWDYPRLPAPNVRDISPFIQEEDERVVHARNAVQNKNVWFLDPIALNTRFLANDPAPATDSRWTPGLNTTADIPELSAPNVTRRWWLGTDDTSEADTDMPEQTPREVITAKVRPVATQRR